MSTDRKWLDEQFARAREVWGPGTEAYKRRQAYKRRKRKKNPQPTCPELPKTLTGDKVRDAVEGIEDYIREAIFFAPKKTRRAKAEKLIDYRHEAIATFFVFCDQKQGRDLDTAMRRMRKVIDQTFYLGAGTPMMDRVTDILAGKYKIGESPQSVTVEEFESKESKRAKKQTRTRKAEPVPAEFDELLGDALEEANKRVFRGPTSPKKGTPAYKNRSWKVAKNSKNVIEVYKPYKGEARYNQRAGKMFPAPGPLSEPTTGGPFVPVEEDYIRVLLIRIPNSNEWSLFLRNTCVVDGKPESSNFRLSFPTKSRELVHEAYDVRFDPDSQSPIFADKANALRALGPVLMALNKLTYSRACAGKPDSISLGDTVDVELSRGALPTYASSRIENPAWLLPAAGALVTAVGLGDSLYQLHAVLRGR